MTRVLGFVAVRSVWFSPCGAAGGILVPQPGVEPTPSSEKAQSSSPWTTGAVCHIPISQIRRLRQRGIE